jgi:protease-4
MNTMHSPEGGRKYTSWYERLKQFFFILLIIQIAPFILINLKNFFSEAFLPKADIGMLSFDGMISSSEFYVKQLHTFLKNPNIKGLLIKIDSPGGVAGSSQALFNELKRFKGKKPVVALVENMCASGSYYIAAAADYIIANPSSMIGSIGVMLGRAGMPMPNFKERMDDWKIKFEYIQAGKYKAVGNSFKEITQEEKSHLQDFVDDTYEQFVNDIAHARGLSVETEKEWADGKIFTGNQALKLKLIDKLGSLQEAIDALKERAGITTEIKFVVPNRKKGLMKLISGNDEGYEGEVITQCIQGLKTLTSMMTGGWLVY